jgi:hypothetical protein
MSTKREIEWSPTVHASDLDRYQLDRPSHTCVDSPHLLCPACEKGKQAAKPKLINPRA